jgi:hypothetical protein
MAAVKTVLKKTTNKVVVRITATASADTATIDLQTDCKMTNETLTGTQRVNIVFTSWSSASDIKLTRNDPAITVAHYFGTGSNEIPQFTIVDQNDQDIVVTFGGAGMIMLELTKVEGFNTPIEDAQFGGADNPTVVGA